AAEAGTEAAPAAEAGTEAAPAAEAAPTPEQVEPTEATGVDVPEVPVAQTGEAPTPEQVEPVEATTPEPTTNEENN
ncbi:MAG TPA: hypothetical protein PL091_07310, partial [Actinomycetota bacterium]|nr:hypothetical protein [Actinomycetota bacterium]